MFHILSQKHCFAIKKMKITTTLRRPLRQRVAHSSPAQFPFAFFSLANICVTVILTKNYDIVSGTRTVRLMLSAFIFSPAD
jgi:hypothetical protein